MNDADWEIRDKPYDLRDRLLNFACVIVKVGRYLHTRGPVAIALSTQVLKSGTSAGANYEESDDGSSERDVLAKRKIALRELKETRFRLRVLRRSGLLTEVHDPVIQKTTELKRILASLVRNTESKLKKQSSQASQPNSNPARPPR